MEEPTEEQAIEILKGLRERYEKHHHVQISDAGIEAAVKLSARYIADRYLPDKAIDLMDEASSKVRLGGFKMPEKISELERKIAQLEDDMETALMEQRFEDAGAIRKEKEAARKKYEKQVEKYHRDADKKKLVVGENEIAEIVSDWTKIPVKRLAEGEAARLNLSLIHIYILCSEKLQKIARNSKLWDMRVYYYENELEDEFNAFDSFAIQLAFEQGKLKKKKMYRVIREGNYTGFPGFYGVLMRHCNTLPLSSNFKTMEKFIAAVDRVLEKMCIRDRVWDLPSQKNWWICMEEPFV